MWRGGVLLLMRALTRTRQGGSRAQSAQSVVRLMSPWLSQLERTMGLSGDGSQFQGPLIGGYDYAGQVGHGGGRELGVCVAPTRCPRNDHKP